MKRLRFLSVGVLILFTLFPVGLAYAQTTAKPSLPQVPISYPGDTDQAIIRRAQWVEGARKEGQLVWWGTQSPGEAVKTIALFNKVYPFIKVEYWRGNGEAIASKLEAGYIAGQTIVDVCQGGEPVNFPRWRKAGRMAPFVDTLPMIKTLDKRMYSKHGDWATPGHTVGTSQYNTKLVSAAEAPKAWEDLLDPKWQGQMSMVTDVKGWVTLALAEGGWGLEKTENFLSRLSKQNVMWGRGNSEMHAMLIAGESKLLVAGYVYHVLRSQTKGAPVAWAPVKPGIANSGPHFYIQTKANHPNAARLFVEWLFSPQGLHLWEQTTSGMGGAFPGMGTKQSKLLEVIPLVAETEDSVQQGIKLGLHQKFSKLLGIVPKK